MGLMKINIASLLVYYFIASTIRLSAVTCQDEDGRQCLPRQTFLALLLMPELNSNLAAYSRTVRIAQDPKNRDSVATLKSITRDDNEEGEICFPTGVYLEFFNHPAMRGYLSAASRAQKLLETPVDIESNLDVIKRSLATLAKNDDLPVLNPDQEEENEDEITSILSRLNFDEDVLNELLKVVQDDRKQLIDIAKSYTLSNGELDLESLARDYGNKNRQMSAMLRESFLPFEKRNIETLARDFALPSGKRNVGTLARDHSLPNRNGNMKTLEKMAAMHEGEKRNIATFFRDLALPSSKRYLDIPFGFDETPTLNVDGKRNSAVLVKSADYPELVKRNVGTLARDWSLPTQNRHTRAMNVTQDAIIVHKPPYLNYNLDTNWMNRQHALIFYPKMKNNEQRNINLDLKRLRRQLDFSDEYSSPVMQNTNVYDYEDLIDTLSAAYPKTAKRFMGRIPHMGPRPTTPPSRRIGR